MTQSIQWHKERLKEQMEYIRAQEEEALSLQAKRLAKAVWLKKQAEDYESQIAEAERQGLTEFNRNEFFSGS